MIYDRNAYMGLSSSPGKVNLKPGLGKRDTALLFQLIKERSGLNANTLAARFAIGGEKVVSHYANGDRRLPADRLRKILKIVKEEEPTWLFAEEVSQFETALTRAEEAAMNIRKDEKLRIDLQAKILAAFAKRSPMFRFEDPLPKGIEKAIQDSISQIEEAMHVYREANLNDHIDLPDPRTMEEQLACQDHAMESYLREMAKEDARTMAARQAYEDALPRQLRRVRPRPIKTRK